MPSRKRSKSSRKRSKSSRKRSRKSSRRSKARDLALETCKAKFTKLKRLMTYVYNTYSDVEQDEKVNSEF